MIDRYLDVYFKGEPEKASVNLLWTKDDYDLKDIFKLQGDLAGISYSGEVSAEEVLNYLGRTLDEACKKHPDLKSRIEPFEDEEEGFQDPNGYGNEAKDFYEKLASGKTIEKMEMLVILD